MYVRAIANTAILRNSNILERFINLMPDTLKHTLKVIIIQRHIISCINTIPIFRTKRMITLNTITS